MQEIKICIIDDNEAVCHSLKFLLNAYYDINIEVYNNPLLFLDEFSSDWRGCLLIDLFMPFINGIDLIPELKKRDNNMSIIMISGHGTPEVAARSLAAGASSFISKPFKIDCLLEKIQSVLQTLQTESCVIE